MDSMTGCNGPAKTSSEVPVMREETVVTKLVPINKKTDFSYGNEKAEKGSHYDVAHAYGEAIRKIFPDFVKIMEPYIYENIYAAFPELTDDFSPVISRMSEIKGQLNEVYVEEIEGLTDALAKEGMPFAMDGVLSKEELCVAQFVPDILRGTQCSGVAAYGEKSETGQTVTLRILEWLMGNENQMAKAHAVVHFKNGEESFTSYGVLSLLEVISATNTSGVFAGILDAGTEGIYSCEGKKSYTFELRYAIEHYKTAEEIARHMNTQTKNFTYSHNIFVTDPKGAYVAEDCVDGEGVAGLRRADSKLMKGLEWHHKNAIAVVNGYVLEGNKDKMTDSDHNMIRWKKFNERLSEYEKVSISDLEDIVTREDPNAYGAHLYSDYTYQMIAIDSEKGTVDIAFAPATDDYPLKPKFVRVLDDLYRNK